MYSTILLLACIQLVIIVTFGAGWTSASKFYKLFYIGNLGASPPYSTLIPYPSGVPGWFSYVAINMYFALAVSVAFVIFLAVQIMMPALLEGKQKIVILADLVVSITLTLILFITYIVFASSLNGAKNYTLWGLQLGYCFGLSIFASLISLAAVIINGICFWHNK
ncbi:unnamed protein product [Caenorhabditis auriculariae]|uniref:MARVEL domain-containing protein n=1 Tax=Caenorhabditis auriculariae TaxID=2777116 RepID=A0A8S1HYC8_9PELO|nr:unnamed protein product [Caenorhabditis auriculariae]